MMRQFITALMLVSLLMAVAEGAKRHEIMQQIDIEQKPGAKLPPELSFRDENNQAVQLGDYFGEQPIILHLAYFRCPMLCNMTQDGLIKTLRTLKLDPGDDFEMLTVSFDPREGAELAATAKQTALRRYGRDGADQAWHFLTGQRQPIEKLTETVGFRYAWDDDRGQFAHAAGVVVLTPEGNISRYLNGVEFTARDLRLALVEASNHEIGTTTDQVLLMCYQYDPTTGRYGLRVARALQVGGGLTVFSLALGVGYLMRQERRQCGRQNAASSSET